MDTAVASDLVDRESGPQDIRAFLHDQPGLKTIHASGVDWEHRDRQAAAWNDVAPTPSQAAIQTHRPPNQPPVSEKPWELWVERDGRQRYEFELGGTRARTVFDGSTWWSWWPRHGGQTGLGAYKGSGSGGELLDVRDALNLLDFAVVGRSSFLGREVLEVSAVPLGIGEYIRRHGISLGVGADEFLWTVDAEFGIVLKSEARHGGRPFRIVETRSVVFDGSLDEETFKIHLPPGEEFDPNPSIRQVDLSSLPSSVNFTVYLLPENQGMREPRAVIRSGDRTAGQGPSITVSYVFPLADGKYRNLWIHQSGHMVGQDTTSPSVGWQRIGGFDAHEERDDGYLLSKVRLIQGGTSIELEAVHLSAMELVGVAHALTPLE